MKRINSHNGAQGLICLPESRRGRRSEAQQVEEDRRFDAFRDKLLEIQSRLDFTPGTRGWCYLAENAGMVTKGDFDRLERLLSDWRREGLLPLCFCASDEKRAAENLESLDEVSPQEYAERQLRSAANCWFWYDPISFWSYQPYYIEVAVEKVDLRELFTKVCAEYHVPIWNAGGWSDLNSRAATLLRFREHVEEGRRCVLLYCGDLDPAGEHISDIIRKNLRDLSQAQEVQWWFPDEDGQLIIDRFGLNIDFIKAHNLTWIDGLETGSGGDLASPKHPDHWKPYVQNYLKKYGPRKVEANALVVRHEAGRRLCRQAILKYIDQDGIRRYQKALQRKRNQVKKALPDVMRTMLDGGNGKPKGR
jgi:hypothetical protein